jgi:protein-disulfide isomerase
MRKILFALTLVAATTAAQAQDATPLLKPTDLTTTNAATQQFENSVHQYLVKKPEVVVEALQAYQQKQADNMQQVFKDTQKLATTNVDAIFHDNANPVAGNPQGKITIVEFSDYQCSHCIEVSPVLDAIMKANPNVRVVFKEFPIRGALSDSAARAALAANLQGKYWPFREALFKVSSALTADKIDDTAKAVGLNLDQLKKDMDLPAMRAAIDANTKLAQTLKLIGTPAFFIAKTDIKNGAPVESIEYVPGMLSQQQLQTFIDKLSK